MYILSVVAIFRKQFTLLFCKAGPVNVYAFLPNTLGFIRKANQTQSNFTLINDNFVNFTRFVLNVEIVCELCGCTI